MDVSYVKDIDLLETSIKEATIMSNNMLRTTIKSLLENNQFLTYPDIAKKLKKDKAKISGYLEAMVDYGDLQVKKAGNSKIYFLNKQVE